MVNGERSTVCESERVEAPADLVARFSKGFDAAIGPGRVRQWPVEPRNAGEAQGTDLIGAQREHQVPACRIDRTHGFRGMGRDIDADLTERVDGERAHARVRRTGVLHTHTIAELRTGESFSHLTPRGVRD